MNHILVAELLVEDAKLRDIEKKLKAARDAADAEAVKDCETQWLKRNNMRNLIIAEMDRSEVELYELQRDHSQDP